MKRYYLYIFFVLLTISCSQNKSSKENDVNTESVPVFTFDHQDSLLVNQLSDLYVNYINTKEFSEAANLLYYVSNDSVFPLTQEQRDGFIQMLNNLSIKGCKAQELILKTDLDNQIKISMLLTDDGDIDSGRGVVNFILNPIKIEGNWYLTLRDQYAEGVGKYNI